MAHELHKIRVRAALKPRKEPYWGPAVADDVTVGFRKVSEDTGYWIARWRRPDPLPGERRYEEDPLGLVTAENGYEAARAAALAWGESRRSGSTGKAFTVGDACREYVEDRRREKGDACAVDADMRFRRLQIYQGPFGAQRVERLRTPAIQKWLQGLGLTAQSEAREWRSVKAALNLAVRNRRAPVSVVREWKDVKPRAGHKGKRRDLYLDIEQRRALLLRTAGDLHDLLSAAALTGARPGELVRAQVRQLDARTQSMTFIGKTGSRTVPISPPALEIFERRAQGKAPDDYIFTNDESRWVSLVRSELITEASRLASLPEGVCLYTLRHSFITDALLGGMPTLEVARLVGTSVSMIERHYGHLVAAVARDRLATLKLL